MFAAFFSQQPSHIVTKSVISLEISLLFFFSRQSSYNTVPIRAYSSVGVTLELGRGEAVAYVNMSSTCVFTADEVLV